MRPFLPVLILLFLGTACSSGPDSEPADSRGSDVQSRTDDFVEYEFFATTRVLAPGDVSEFLVGVTDGEVHVSSAVSWGDAVAPEDILLAAPGPLAPGGFVRRVTKVTRAGETLVLATESAHPALAFKHLEARVSGIVELGSGAAGKADRSGVGQVVLALGTGPVEVDFYAFNGDGDPGTPEDQVRVQGTFEGTIGYELTIGIDWPSFTTWPPDVLPDLKAELDVTLAAEATLAVSGMAAKAFSREENLGEIPIVPPIVIWPLTFNPAISLDAAIEGSAAGAYEISTGVGASVTVGASITTDGDVGYDPPTTAFSHQPPKVAASWHAGARVSAGPTLHIRLYDSMGPYAGLRAFADLAADVDHDPCWELHGGLEGVIGFDMRVAGLDIADWSTGFDIGEQSLGTGACEEHPALDGATDIIPATFEPWSRVLVDAAATASADDSRVVLEPTADGHYLVAGSEMVRVLKLSRTGEVVEAWELVSGEGGGPVRVAALCEGLDGTLHLALDKPAGVARLAPDGTVTGAANALLPVSTPAPFAAIHCRTDGGVVVAGAVADEAPGDADLWVTRLDASGSVVWSRRWGLPDRAEEPTALVPLGEDLLVLVRAFRVGDEPAARSAVLRLTDTGELVWQRTLAGCNLFAGLTLRTGVLSRDGDLLAAGQLEGGANAAVTLKLKPDGSLAWANAADGEFLGLDTTALVQLSDGGFLTAGTWWRADQDDLWLGRTDSVGRFYWLQRYDTGVGDVTPALALTGEGGVLLGGYTKQGDAHNSLWMSRLPVADGVISFAPASGAKVNAEEWTNYDEPCLEVSAETVDWKPFPVTWEETGIAVTPVTQTTAPLAP